jgi:hypothetical protein
MTFDARSRQAAQGIRRAVEVMEMSDTKTPQRLTRFDRYQDGKSRNKRVAALALGIAVPLMLVVTAVLVLGPRQDRNVPMTSPSTSVATGSTIGDSGKFREPFTYALPPGWTLDGADPGWLSLNPPPAIESGTSFYVLSNMRATRPDCSNQPNQSVGSSSEAMTRWFSRHPALEATSPRPITLPGASGSWVDLKLAAGWDQSTCKHGLPLIMNPHGEGWGFEHNTDEMRFYVLDLPDGNTVTVVVDVQHAKDFSHVIDQAAPVVKSFDFSA